jgi:histidyl-tRNA synthetase
MGPVWRNEKPGIGRYRQFYQCDADTIGSSSIGADVEICTMLCDSLEAVGIERNDYIVKINNRKILNGIMEVVGLLDGDNPDINSIKRGIVLRAIDKFDRLGIEGVKELLGDGRKDESGDFSKGAELSSEQIGIIIGFVKAKKDSTAQTLQALSELVKGSAIGLTGVEELLTLLELSELQGYASNRIQLDPSVVRGLGYYTGPVYEAELTFEVRDEFGIKRQFGSVAGGGRYDDLVKRFTGQEVPATGVSIGVDRLLVALHSKNVLSLNSVGPVIVTVMDRSRLF